jgi:hypothetical protein
MNTPEKSKFNMAKIISTQKIESKETKEENEFSCHLSDPSSRVVNPYDVMNAVFKSNN